MQIRKLKDIVEISSGYSFRTAIKHQEDGNVFVVSAKDIKDNFYVNKKELIKTELPTFKDYLIKKGNVLLSARGYFKASVLEIEENVIGSPSIYILKIIDEKIILPEHLALWINSKIGQKEIERNQTGTIIKTILRSDLENIKINIPSLKKQKQLMELYQTTDWLNGKLKRKKELVESIFQNSLIKVINK